MNALRRLERSVVESDLGRDVFLKELAGFAEGRNSRFEDFFDFFRRERFWDAVDIVGLLDLGRSARGGMRRSNPLNVLPIKQIADGVVALRIEGDRRRRFAVWRAVLEILNRDPQKGDQNDSDDAAEEFARSRAFLRCGSSFGLFSFYNFLKIGIYVVFLFSVTNVDDRWFSHGLRLSL